MTRTPVDPDVHATPCRVVDLGCDAEAVAAALDAMARARALLSRPRKAGRWIVDCPALPSRRRAGTPILEIRNRMDGVLLEIRHRNGGRVLLAIGPNAPATTRFIRPAPGNGTTPEAAASRILSAFAVHLRGMSARRMEEADVARAMRTLEGIQTLVRTTRPLPPETTDRHGATTGVHDHGKAEAATPWSPLRARTVLDWVEPGRDQMTAAERRRWAMPPIVTITAATTSAVSTSAHAKSAEHTPDAAWSTHTITIGALTAEFVEDPDPMEDMRRLLALDPPPPIRPRAAR